MRFPGTYSRSRHGRRASSSTKSVLPVCQRGNCLTGAHRSTLKAISGQRSLRRLGRRTSRYRRTPRRHPFPGRPAPSFSVRAGHTADRATYLPRPMCRPRPPLGLQAIELAQGPSQSPPEHADHTLQLVRSSIRCGFKDFSVIDDPARSSAGKVVAKVAFTDCKRLDRCLLTTVRKGFMRQRLWFVASPSVSEQETLDHRGKRDRQCIEQLGPIALRNGRPWPCQLTQPREEWRR